MLLGYAERCNAADNARQQTRTNAAARQPRRLAEQQPEQICARRRQLPSPPPIPDPAGAGHAGAGSGAGIGAGAFLAGALRLGAAFFAIFFATLFVAAFIVLFFLRAGAAFFLLAFLFAFFAMIVLPFLLSVEYPVSPGQTALRQTLLPHDAE